MVLKEISTRKTTQLEGCPRHIRRPHPSKRLRMAGNRQKSDARERVQLTFGLSGESMQALSCSSGLH